MNNMDWALFSHLVRTQHQYQHPHPGQTEHETQRLLRETLNAPSPYKYVLDPERIDDVVTHTKYTNDSDNDTATATATATTTTTTTTTCPITMEDFIQDEPINKLPCGHIFKPDAIDNWLLTEKAECPVCRYKLPCIEVRNPDETTFQEELSTATQPDQEERDDTNRNVIAFINSLHSLNNLGQL